MGCLGRMVLGTTSDEEKRPMQDELTAPDKCLGSLETPHRDAACLLDVAAQSCGLGSKLERPLAVAKPIEAVREQTIVDVGRLPLDGADVGLAVVRIRPLRAALIG